MMTARLIWVGGCVIAAAWLFAQSVPIWLICCALIFSCVPVLTGILLRSFMNEASSVDVESVLWVGLASLGVGVTGGAGSPLLVLFAVPIAFAGLERRGRLMLEVSAFAVFGFFVAMIVNSMRGSFLGADGEMLGVAFATVCVAMVAALGVIGYGRFDEERRIRQAQNDQAEREVGLRLKQLQARVAVAERDAGDQSGAIEALEAALSSRTRFFAQTSHELRTPLNAILGFADLMKNELFGPLPEKYKEYVGLIHEGGRDLELVMDDVLDLSRIEAGRYEIAPEQISLTELAEDAIRFLRDAAERKGVQLVLEDTVEDVEGYADPKAFRQIALNLMSNALKFSPEGAAVRISLVEAPNGALFAVSDVGAGISVEDLERLSRAFEQTDEGRKHKGSGLGLSIVRAFCDLHGGRMDIESREGGGTTVGVFFPNRL